MLVNPDCADLERLPPVLKRREAFVAPRPDPMDDATSRISTCSLWVSVNVLMLDERLVVVDASQPTSPRTLRDWGFEPKPLPSLANRPSGGSFHRATLDVRHRSALRGRSA